MFLVYANGFLVLLFLVSRCYLQYLLLNAVATDIGLSNVSNRIGDGVILDTFVVDSSKFILFPQPYELIFSGLAAAVAGM